MKITLYTVVSPDGITIENVLGYRSPEKALEAFEAWKKRFEAQGFYSSVDSGRIPLEDLDRYCEFDTTTAEVFPRKCSCCGKGMTEGYCIDGGEEYFCSDECLHTEYTKEEFEAKYAEGDGDSYWTEWPEEEIDLDDELIFEENF